MYRVLLIDDETIILSGIKFLIDWSANDCTICGTAYNGQDALNQIEACPPDIVFCDINMPILNGIDLLKIVAEKYPSVVFVMLTNLQEFDLVREAFRFHAVDYLLKAKLEASALEKCLKTAIAECQTRNEMSQTASLKYFNEKNKLQVISSSCLEILLAAPGESFQRAAEILSANHMDSQYGFLNILFDYTNVSNPESFTSKARSELLEWQKELLGKLADTVFQKHYLIVDMGQMNAITIFCWEQQPNWEEKARLFSRKFASYCSNVTQASCQVLFTHSYHGKAQFLSCRNEYLTLGELYYLQGMAEWKGELKRPEYEPLNLVGIGAQLEIEIRRNNFPGCQTLLDKAIERLKKTPHQKGQAIWLCNELNRSMTLALKEYTSLDPLLVASSYGEIDSLLTRSQIIAWIDRLKNSIVHVIRNRNDLTSDSLETARQYILNHIEERISLQDVADYVNLSTGYLSTMFKKKYGQGLIDYANQLKIEHSCKMLQENQYLINEIAQKLGFENAYYFSKVFNKYMGISPSEYQKSTRNKDN